MKLAGTQKDLSGEDGISMAEIDAFLAEIEKTRTWHQTESSVQVFGEETAAVSAETADIGNGTCCHCAGNVSLHKLNCLVAGICGIACLLVTVYLTVMFFESVVKTRLSPADWQARFHTLSRMTP